MDSLHFTDLLVVCAIAFAAPLVLGIAPRVRLPAVVLSIVAGIVVGPSGLDWVQVDEPVAVFSLVGLAMLLFLAGLEVEFDRLRGRLLRLTLLAFALSFGLALLVGLLLGNDRQTAAAGLLQATSLPFIIASTEIGLTLHLLSRATAAGLVAAGLLSVLLFPLLGLTMLRRGKPATDVVG